MAAVELILAIGWAAFWAYWLLAAFSSTRRGHVPVGRHLRIRAVLIVVMVVAVRLGAFRGHGVSTNPWRAAAGLVLFGFGLGVAVWARRHIGRSWGTPMSEKVGTGLVTSGPYRFVRHPIYSGIILAGVGTAVALSWWWLVAVAIVGTFFVYSATVEEQWMTKQFPYAYPAYQRSTKMLIPFVF